VEDLRKQYRIVVIIGLAMMASVLVYAVIVGLIEKEIIPMRVALEISGEHLGMIKYVMFAVCAVIFFVIRIVRSVMLAAGTAVSGSSRTGSAAQDLPETGRLVSSSVITFAMCEFPAVLGLVLYILGRSSTDFDLFLLISLFFFAVYFPKYSDWEAWARERQKPGRAAVKR